MAGPARLNVIEQAHAEFSKVLESQETVRRAVEIKCEYLTAFITRCKSRLEDLPPSALAYRALRNGLEGQLRRAQALRSRWKQQVHPDHMWRTQAEQVLQMARLQEQLYSSNGDTRSLPGIVTLAEGTTRHVLPTSTATVAAESGLQNVYGTEVASRVVAAAQRPHLGALPELAVPAGASPAAAGVKGQSRQALDTEVKRIRAQMKEAARVLSAKLGYRMPEVVVSMDEICENCCVPMIVCSDAAAMWCPSCPRVREYTDTTTHTTDHGTRREVRYERPDRVDPINKELRRIQAKENFRIPNEVVLEVGKHLADIMEHPLSNMPARVQDLTFGQFNDIVRSMRKYYGIGGDEEEEDEEPEHDDDRAQDTASQTAAAAAAAIDGGDTNDDKEALVEVPNPRGMNLRVRANIRQYYPNMMQLYCRTTDNTPPRFSDTEVRIVQCLCQMLKPVYELYKGNRSNSFQAKNCIYKTAELMGFSDFLPYFSVMRTEETRRGHDRIWEQMMHHAGLPFIPSKAPVRFEPLKSGGALITHQAAEFYTFHREQYNQGGASVESLAERKFGHLKARATTAGGVASSRTPAAAVAVARTPPAPKTTARERAEARKRPRKRSASTSVASVASSCPSNPPPSAAAEAPESSGAGAVAPMEPAAELDPRFAEMPTIRRRRGRPRKYPGGPTARGREALAGKEKKPAATASSAGQSILKHFTMARPPAK